MDSTEIQERAAGFAKSILAGRLTLEHVAAKVRGWVAPGFLTEQEAEQLVDLVAAAV